MSGPTFHMLAHTDNQRISSPMPTSLLGVATGLSLGLLILTLGLHLGLVLVGGAILVLGALFSVEFGMAALLILVILFPRTDLFSASIPFFGGGLKPTDILLIAILSGWIARLGISRARTTSVRQPFTVLVVGFVLWATVCAAIAVSRGVYYKYSLLELRPLLQYLIFLPIASTFTLKNVKRIIWVILLVGSIVALKAIILYTLGHGQPASYTDGGIRIDVGFTYLLFSFLLASSLYLKIASRGFTLVAVALLSICGLTVTFQRSAWLAMAASLAFIFYVSRTQMRKRAFKLGAYVLLLGCLVYAFASMRGANSVNPVGELGTRMASILEYREDVSAQHRLIEWGATLEMLRSRPIVGNGLGTSVSFYSPMYSPNREKMGFWSSDFYVHNSYLWVTMKMGLIGFGLFAAMIVLIFQRGMCRIRSATDEDRPVYVGLSACLVALVVVSLFGPTFTTDDVTPFVGFAFGAMFVRSPSTSQPSSHETSAV